MLSSHDAPRHRTRFDDAAAGDARARVAALMLLTLRGTPFLYYGEELGMRDGEIPPERICDPVGQRFPSLGRDPERTPMPWDASAHAGFSTADPWLPLGGRWPTVNVAAQRDDPGSMLSFYRRAPSGGGNRRRRVLGEPAGARWPGGHVRVRARARRAARGRRTELHSGASRLASLPAARRERHRPVDDGAGSAAVDAISLSLRPYQSAVAIVECARVAFGEPDSVSAGCMRRVAGGPAATGALAGSGAATNGDRSWTGS